MSLYLAGISTGAVADSCPEPPPTPECSRVLVEFLKPLQPDSRHLATESGLLPVLRLRLKEFGVTEITQGVGSLPNVLILTVEKSVLDSQERLGKLRTKLEELGKLPQLGGLDYFEPSILWVPRTIRPNDPRFRAQEPVLDQVNAPAAWDRIAKIQHSPAIVAVIDTGMRYDHLDLREQMWSGNPAHGENFSGGAAADTRDRAGHGTQVAGALAATSNNKEGLASIPWKNSLRLVIAKYADSLAGGCTENLINSIDYAATVANASILNLSAGQNQCSVPLRKELETLRDSKDRTLLVAAVDDQDLHAMTDLDAPGAQLQDYPTSYHLSNVIAVQAANGYGGLFNSVYGKVSVHLAAPGADVQTTGNGDNSDYTSAPGTSLAAPQVSATAALISSFAPRWRHEQIRQYLVDSARNPACALPGAPAPDEYSLCGKSQSGGVLNVDAATGAPVVVDAPFEGARWSPGTAHKVRWHPLFITDLCPYVDLFFSTDDGANWSALNSDPPIPSTRDMAATVMLPPDVRKTDSARIAVRCHDTARLERWSDTFTVD
jgi:subtilisin family serine protease